MIKTPTHIRGARIRGESGQSMVEFAVILPLIAMLFLGIWQCGVAFHKYLVFTDAARVGARKAAVSVTATGGPCAAAKAAIQNTVSASQWSTDLQSGARVTCSGTATAGQPYTISISYPFNITVFFTRSRMMNASATERLE
jgi:Flp pilus assembly protein TadG